MTERKFTPPTEFPAEYVTRCGSKAVIVGTMPDDDHPYIGYVPDEKGASAEYWDADGSVGMYMQEEYDDYDLFDIGQEPRKQVHWANDYATWSTHEWYKDRKDADDNAVPARIARIRREWVEGQPPQYFTEQP